MSDPAKATRFATRAAALGFEVAPQNGAWSGAWRPVGKPRDDQAVRSKATADGEGAHHDR